MSWLCMAWYGMIWYGLVRYNSVGFGTVLYGVVWWNGEVGSKASGGRTPDMQGPGIARQARQAIPGWPG